VYNVVVLVIFIARKAKITTETLEVIFVNANVNPKNYAPQKTFISLGPGFMPPKYGCSSTILIFSLFLWYLSVR
jgi:hypothetical protein